MGALSPHDWSSERSPDPIKRKKKKKHLCILTGKQDGIEAFQETVPISVEPTSLRALQGVNRLL